MEYPELVPGVLLRRYKRFLADVRLDDGREVTAHCPNTGSMRAVNVPGCRVWLSASDDPRRKLAWTWELIELPRPGGAPALVSVHTGRTNRIVEEALRRRDLPTLADYATLRREATVAFEGAPAARLDFCLEAPGRGPTFVEVKQVTLREADGHGYFPDAVSVRGRKHLDTLAGLAARGRRAVLLFCVAHEDLHDVAPATHLDPAYAETLHRVAGQGVELMAHRCHFRRAAGRPVAVELGAALPVCLTRPLQRPI